MLNQDELIEAMRRPEKRAELKAALKIMTNQDRAFILSKMRLHKDEVLKNYADLWLDAQEACELSSFRRKAIKDELEQHLAASLALQAAATMLIRPPVVSDEQAELLDKALRYAAEKDNSERAKRINDLAELYKEQLYQLQSEDEICLTEVAETFAELTHEIDQQRLIKLKVTTLEMTEIDLKNSMLNSLDAGYEFTYKPF